MRAPSCLQARDRWQLLLLASSNGSEAAAGIGLLCMLLHAWWQCTRARPSDAAGVLSAGSPADPGLSGKRFTVLYLGSGTMEYGNVQVGGRD